MNIWEWLGGRAAEFDGPAWTTLGIGVAAFLTSLYSLWRQRVQRPVFRLANFEASWVKTIAYEGADKNSTKVYADPVITMRVTKYGGDLAEASISIYPLLRFVPWKADRTTLKVLGNPVYSSSELVECQHSRFNFYICHIRFRLMATPRFNRHRFSIRFAKPSAD